MKKIFTRQVFFGSAGVIVATSFFVACQKDLPLTPWTPGEIVVTGSAKVMFIHASPNIYLPNSVSLSFNGGSVATLNYGDKTGYFEASTGTTYQSFNAFTTAVLDSTQTLYYIASNGDTIYYPKEWWCPNKEGLVYDMQQVNAVLKPGERYAAYITGNRYHARYLMVPAETVPEEHAGTTQDTCTVRIINLISEVDTANVINTNTGSALLSKEVFTGITNSITIVSGSITLEYWDTDDAAPLLTKTFNLQPRKIYNIVFKGLINGSGNQALDAELIEIN
ncbi:MAG: hypothetical protein ACHQNT_13120 [Bacteroidia bacterium]